MQKHALIIIFLFLPVLIQCESKKVDFNSVTRTEFAITICPGVNSSLVNYAIVTVNGNTIVAKQQLSEQSFMMQITGRMASKANSKMKNLLKEKVLDTCDCVIDNLYKKYYGFNCYPFTILWKVRYKYDPRYQNEKDFDENLGWAVNNYCPSKAQLDYLCNRYNIKTLNDFICGENMFMLLNDVLDTTWINNYYILE